MLTATDLFAGAGGSSTGMIQVPGVQVRLAANHWPTAVEIHNANHPDTDHSTADLHEEDPAYFPRTDILWASPECTKWSQANGSQLPDIEEGLFEDSLSDKAKTRSRLLMFDVLRFIEHHRYRLVFVENVVDIATQAKYRLAWQEWRAGLRRLGYSFRVISLNSMHAQTFGDPAPQSRDRIYIAAWPQNEAAPDFERILRPRAYCPTCDAVIEAQQGWKNGKTVGRYRQAYIYLHGPCGTVVEPGWLPAAHAIDWSIIGERIGDRLKPKTRARIAAGIARYWGPLAVPVEGRNAKEARPTGWPMRTQTTRAETAVVTPFISELYGTAIGRPVTAPAATFTAGGNHHGLVTTAGGSWNDQAKSTAEALRTLTTRDAYALVQPYFGNTEAGKPATDPLGTLTTVDRYALVTRHNSSKGNGAEMTTPAAEYLRSLTTKGDQSITQHPDRRRPTVADLRAAEELVPECLFRMLGPHEVAAGMAFPTDYNWQPPNRERPVSKRDLVKAAGNAVTPPCARDLMAVGAASLGAA